MLQLSIKRKKIFAPLAQLYRALVFGTKGCGLESLVEHHSRTTTLILRVRVVLFIINAITNNF